MNMNMNMNMNTNMNTNMNRNRNTNMNTNMNMNININMNMVLKTRMPETKFARHHYFYRYSTTLVRHRHAVIMVSPVQLETD
jgi:hypothetical protein